MLLFMQTFSYYMSFNLNHPISYLSDIIKKSQNVKFKRFLSHPGLHHKSTEEQCCKKEEGQVGYCHRPWHYGRKHILLNVVIC
jgi:hypothetical protein